MMGIWDESVLGETASRVCQIATELTFGEGTRAYVDGVCHEASRATRRTDARAIGDSDAELSHQILITESNDMDGNEGAIEFLSLEELGEDEVAYFENPLGRLVEEETLDEIRKIAEGYHHPWLWAIIKYRFGLEGGQGHNLDETAAEFGITRERVRQYEAMLFHHGFTVDHNGKIVRKSPHARRGRLRDCLDNSD